MPCPSIIDLFERRPGTTPFIMKIIDSNPALCDTLVHLLTCLLGVVEQVIWCPGRFLFGRCFIRGFVMYIKHKTEPFQLWQKLWRRKGLHPGAQLLGCDQRYGTSESQCRDTRGNKCMDIWEDVFVLKNLADREDQGL